MVIATLPAIFFHPTVVQAVTTYVRVVTVLVIQEQCRIIIAQSLEAALGGLHCRLNGYFWGFPGDYGTVHTRMHAVLHIPVLSIFDSPIISKDCYKHGSAQKMHQV